MIIYKRRRIQLIRNKGRKVKPIVRTINDESYISINWKSHKPYNEYYMSKDGVNRGKQTFLKWRHLYASYQVDYNSEKNYTNLTKVYLLHVLDSTYSFDDLWSAPTEYELYRFHKFAFSDAYRVDFINKMIKEYMIKMILYVLLMLVVVFYTAILPIVNLFYYTEKTQYSVITQAFIIPLLFLIRWNFNMSQFGAVQMFFNIPFFAMCKFLAILVPFIGMFFLVLLSTYLKGINGLNIQNIIIVIVNLTFYLSLAYLSYLKLFKKNQLLF